MTGEIEAAEAHKLPQLIQLADIRGDLQMHTTASDGRNSIEEMGEAAKKLGYEYIALTDHSKAVTVANGMDDKRTLAQIKKIRAAALRPPKFRLESAPLSRAPPNNNSRSPPPQYRPIPANEPSPRWHPQPNPPAPGSIPFPSEMPRAPAENAPGLAFR